jgi:hypothetical protein
MHKHNLGTLLKPVPRDVAEVRLKAIAQSFFESIDTPKSLAASILLREGEYAQLVALDVDPLNYKDAHSFADDYQAVKLLSKFPSFRHPDLDPLKAGKESFLLFERQCRKTNLRFRELSEDPNKWDPTMRGILYLARRKISHVLGEPDLDAISELFGWGPGATSVSRGHYTSALMSPVTPSSWVTAV